MAVPRRGGDNLIMRIVDYPFEKDYQLQTLLDMFHNSEHDPTSDFCWNIDVAFVKGLVNCLTPNQDDLKRQIGEMNTMLR